MPIWSKVALYNVPFDLIGIHTLFLEIEIKPHLVYNVSNCYVGMLNFAFELKPLVNDLCSILVPHNRESKILQDTGKMDPTNIENNDPSRYVTPAILNARWCVLQVLLYFADGDS